VILPLVATLGDVIEGPERASGHPRWPATTSFSVLVADDHARTRASLIEVLDGSEDFYVCGEAHDATGAVVAAKCERPDVCLLDINMPGNGIWAAGRIASTVPTAAIVMLTVSREDDDLFDALRAGASGYLLKGLDLEHIPGCLKQVLAGEACLPGTLVARLVEEFRDREYRRTRVSEGPAARLTGREWDVLELMRAGLSTAAVAERLFVSQTTVRSHVASVVRKLRVKDREAAIALLSHQ
jgi:DNA-binding NarL/FixJ family response regulator